MNIAEKAQDALTSGFAAIAKQFQLPADFPPEVMAEAKAVAETKPFTKPDWQSHRHVAMDIPFVTLDPASSTDLDQAFYIEKDGPELVLHYALADVSAFVKPGSLIEQEARKRGVTIYGLAKKIPVYPSVISQGTASLLPEGPRPAVHVVVAIDRVGNIRLRSIDRIVCQSRAKLAYDDVDIQSIPHLEEFANRMWTNETERGAVRVDFPQQEVIIDSTAPGGVRLVLRPRVLSETINSALSLSVNMAIGTLLQEAKVGLFRVMDEPEQGAIAALRRTAHALGIQWLPKETLRELQRRMDPNDYCHQRFLLDARRAGGRARYAMYDENKHAWHFAIGATYAHATAPMRRLADRYVLDLALCVANNLAVPSSLTDQIAEMPVIMDRCEGRASNVDRAVIDLLEAVSLQDRIGEILDAEVVDVANGIVQTRDSAIRAKATKLPKVENGACVRVRIDAADPTTRSVRLSALQSPS